MLIFFFINDKDVCVILFLFTQVQEHCSKFTVTGVFATH